MSRALIIEKALAEEGKTENPAGSNKTKYGLWYGLDGYPWCAMFVSWVYDQAGHPLGRIDHAKGFCGCQSGYNHFKATNQLNSVPKKGDYKVLYDGKVMAIVTTPAYLYQLDNRRVKILTLLKEILL